MQARNAGRKRQRVVHGIERGDDAPGERHQEAAGPERHRDGQPRAKEPAKAAAPRHGRPGLGGIAARPQLPQRMLESRLQQARERERREQLSSAGEGLRVLVGVAQEEGEGSDGGQPAECACQSRRERRASPLDGQQAKPEPAHRLRRRDQERKPEQAQRRAQAREGACPAVLHRQRRIPRRSSSWERLVSDTELRKKLPTARVRSQSPARSVTITTTVRP